MPNEDLLLAEPVLPVAVVVVGVTSGRIISTVFDLSMGQTGR